MIKLDQVHTIHPDFVRWMQDDPDRDMSDDVYGNVRSAAMSLFTAYRVRTDDLDVAAKEATGGVRTEHAAAAAQGKARVKKAKAPLPFGRVAERAR